MAIEADFAEHLAGVAGAELIEVHMVSGGDINQARHLEFASGDIFLKFSTRSNAEDNLRAEARGLEAIAQTGVVETPGVVGSGTFGNKAYLLLEFIATSRPTPDLWAECGMRLADLHRTTSDSYGFESDNFIGALPQSNKRHGSWVEFYLVERLSPQWAMASAYFADSDHALWNGLIKRLDQLLVDEGPSLIHGDLWGGNVIFSSTSPYLIDPAVCYGNREMDIAMSRLFGGFGSDFYRAYNEAFPLVGGWEDRLPLYQLYYLLVHVNLFGASYVSGVREVLRRYQ